MPEVNLKWEGDQLAVDDDQTSNVLLSRQVAHEYHAPAVQALIQADKAAQQVAKQAAMTEMDEFKKEQSKKQAEGKAAAGSFTAGMVSDLASRKGEVTPEAVKGVEKEATAEVGGLEAPMVDPTQAAAAGAGAAFSLSRAAGMALMPSLARAGAAGVVNMVTDPIYGTAAEVVGASHPSLALPFNIAVGLLGGMTFERAIEGGIVKAAAAAGRKLDVAGIAEQVQMIKGVLANESGAVGKNISRESGGVVDDLTSKGSIGTAVKSRGVKGDNYLNSMDLYDDLVDKGAEINKDGFVTLYHRTTPENAQKIVKTGVMVGKEDRLFFGTLPEGQIDGYGEAVVKVKIPIEKLELNDIFTNEAHVTLKGSKANLNAEIWNKPQQVDDLTKQAVIDEVNAEIKNLSVADILKSQKGEVVIRQGAETAPAGSGVPAVSGMQAKADEFLTRKTPDITGEFSPGSNVRLRGISDLKPKWMNALDEGEDINRTLARMTETFEPQITESTRGVVSHAQTELEAQGLTLEDALGRQHGTTLNAAQTRNLGLQTVEGLSALTEMQKVVNSGMASPVDQLGFMDTFNKSYMMLMQYVGNAAELGRAVEIHKQLKRATGMKLGELKDFMQGLHGLSPEEIAKRMEGMDSIGKMAAFVKQAHRATTINMWNESYINGMLWLPTTHMANITSNTLTDVMSVGERYIAAAISQSPIGSGQITFHEAQAYAYGMMQGTKDAWRVFADVVKTGKPSDTMSKLDLSGVGEKAITADNVAFNLDKAKRSISKLAGREIDKTIPPMEFEKGSPFKIGIDAIGEAIRTPGRFLLAEDDAFKTLSYRAELHALSHRKATMEFSGNVDASKADLAKRGIDFAGMNDEKIVRTAMSNRIAEIIDDPLKHAPEVSVGAKENARYLTYTSPITNRVVNAIRASQNPLLKMLIPFTGTPYNIFRYTTERTPLFGFALQSMRDDFNAGGARRDLALAKQAIGTMVWGAAAGMVAASGEDSPVKVYGYGPREPNRRKAWLRDGHKPYSFEFGGTTVEYGRMEPFASIFGIAVDGCEIMGMSSEKLAPETDKIFPAFMAATAQGYLSKTFLAGISGGVKAFYEADANKMQQLINSWGKAAVPFSSAIRGIEQVVSPQRKSVDGLFDAITSEIPGLSDKLPLQRDLWGRTMSKEIEKDESYLQTAIRATSPIYVSMRQDSPIDKELYQNFKEGLPMPRHEQNFLGQFENSPHNSSIKSIPYEMNPRQYEQFQKFMNETPLPSTDMTLKKSLDHMVKSDEGYKNEKDKDKKFDMIRSKVKEAIKVARAKMYETDADIQEVVDTLQQEAIANR